MPHDRPLALRARAFRLPSESVIDRGDWMPVLRSYDVTRAQAEREIVSMIEACGAWPVSPSCAPFRLPRPILVGVDARTARSFQELGAERGLLIDVRNVHEKTGWMVQTQPESLFFGAVYMGAWSFAMLASAAAGSILAILVAFAIPLGVLLLLARRGHDLLVPMARRRIGAGMPAPPKAPERFRGRDERRAAARIDAMLDAIDAALAGAPPPQRARLEEPHRRATLLAAKGLECLSAAQASSDALRAAARAGLADGHLERLRRGRQEAWAPVLAVIGALERVATDLLIAAAPHVSSVDSVASSALEQASRTVREMRVDREVDVAPAGGLPEKSQVRRWASRVLAAGVMAGCLAFATMALAEVMYACR